MAFVKRADLSADDTNAVLGYLWNKLGVTKVRDLNGLKEKYQEVLLELVPQLKKEVPSAS